jgi:hypothetical protein
MPWALVQLASQSVHAPFGFHMSKAIQCEWCMLWFIKTKKIDKTTSKALIN